jgi:2-keto-4-pentenoate hydratase
MRATNSPSCPTTPAPAPSTWDPSPRRPDDLGDLRPLGSDVLVEGDDTATATAAAVMGHSAASVWLANQLALEGEPLKPGN